MAKDIAGAQRRLERRVVMRSTKIQRAILRAVALSADGLHVYTIHRRFGVSPAQLSDVIDGLLSNGYIELRDDKMRISDSGFDFARRIGLDAELQDKPKWRDCPVEFRGDLIKPFEPYIPRIRLLDHTIFPVANKTKQRKGGL